jgi:hypothetical protein
MACRRFAAPWLLRPMFLKPLSLAAQSANCHMGYERVSVGVNFPAW